LAAVGKRWLFGSCEQVKQKVKGLGGVVFQNQRQCVVSASELVVYWYFELFARVGVLSRVGQVGQNSHLKSWKSGQTGQI
jgi:hypothetical protein